jgi:DNA polymerase I-like protein with 3'-5' exonuclease and polymerase domains
MILLPIDFEFKNSQNKTMDMVACATPNQTWWLYNNEENKIKVKTYLESIRDTHLLTSYNAIAEARSFLSLGLDPMSFKWIDLMVAYRWLINNPEMDKEHRKHSLIACCNTLFVTHFFEADKLEIVEMILKNSEFSEKEMSIILEYCKSDTLPLEELYTKLLQKLSSTYNISEDKVLQYLMGHSKYVIATAKVENSGIPVNMESILNLNDNYDIAKKTFIEKCLYSFWVIKQGDYVKSDIKLREYVESKNLVKVWPKTDKGKLSWKDKDLEKITKTYLLPEIESYRSLSKLISGLSRVNPEKENGILNYIGTDHKLRTYYNPFGGQTGRNQPRSTDCLFLWSSVFRCLMTPEPGYVITEIDWAAQEFAIGAYMSKDKNMIESYESGDPYLYFAKLVGAVPKEGTKKTHSLLRQAFKSTVLGLQYGMGARSLSIKLTLETGKLHSEQEAADLISSHRKAYPQYWAWLKAIDTWISCGKILFLKDGWSIISSQDRKYSRSIRNFPVQGTGACILRASIVEAIEQGLMVIGSCHDSIYLYHKETDGDMITNMLRIMDNSVKKIIGDGAIIRADQKTIKYGEPWISDKAKDIYPEFSKFLLPIEHEKKQEYPGNYSLFEKEFV